MAEGHGHHLFQNGDGVTGGFRKAKTEDAVHSLGVAIAAYIMAFHAAGLALLLLMANGTLHDFILRQIFQRCLTNQAFFFHGVIPPFQFHYLTAYFK
jgi:hypothetical protein